MSKSQEYKCPKCSMWDDGFPIMEDKIKCSVCSYIGNIKEFEAKRYNCYAQIIVGVIAFNEEDAKKEFDIIVRDDEVALESCLYNLIKIVEAN